MAYVIVMTAPDGTVSACGTFASTARAQTAARVIEQLGGLDAAVVPVESYESVIAEIEGRS